MAKGSCRLKKLPLTGSLLILISGPRGVCLNPQYRAMCGLRLDGNAVVLNSCVEAEFFRY